jgi:MYXO-CTERM domain-containing protein
MLPTSVGVGEPDIEWRVALPNGLALRVNALLVDNIRTATRDFNDRYNALSTEADVIAYNGHAGLGDNVAALSRKGSFRSGKYQIIFINGCDTFAYYDETLAQTRARLNPDDPTGTKYMEIITNSMPSLFSSNATADMAIINGLINVGAPRTYEAMFRGIDSSQIVVVTGEEDNVFTPDRDAGDWPPLPPPPPGDVDAGTVPPPDQPPTDPPPVDPPSDDVDAGGTPPAIDASDGSDPRPPRGCNCRLENGTPAPRGAAVATLLLAGMATLRRKRRRD